MTKHNISHALKRQLGYTIDQTILIVSVIAILVTMIIGSVGWDLISRAGGTKLQSHLTQMKQAAGSFFGQYGLWPTDVTNNDATQAMLALVDPDSATFDSNFGSNDANTDKFRNYLSSYSIESGNVKHPFGAGGNVTLTTDNPDGDPDGQQYLVFELEDLPSREYENADEGLDGKIDAGSGLVQIDSNSDLSNNTVTLRYFANVTR